MRNSYTLFRLNFISTTGKLKIIIKNKNIKNSINKKIKNLVCLNTKFKKFGLLR